MQQDIANKKNDSIAIAVTIVVHGLLLLLFWWIVAWVELDPPPPPTEEGVVVNFGYTDQGSGDNFRNQDDPMEQQTESQTTPPSPAQEDILTGNDQTYTVPPTPPTPVPPNPNVTPTPPTPPTPDPRFDFNNRNKQNNNNTSDGNTNQTGNQGILNGSLESDVYGNTMGHSFAGWSWEKEPVLEKERQPGKIYFAIQVDADGRIFKADYIASASTINTPTIIAKYKEQLLKSEFKTVGKVATVNNGTVLFEFKY